MFNDAASIDTGLELVIVVGLVCQTRSIYNLHIKGNPTGGMPTASLIVKSVSFKKKNKYQLLIVL